MLMQIKWIWNLWKNQLNLIKKLIRIFRRYSTKTKTVTKLTLIAECFLIKLIKSMLELISQIFRTKYTIKFLK